MKIAVILVSYNQQQYIIEALEGIRLQTRTPDEVVIADDGSTDKTQELIRQYVEQHNLGNRWQLLLSQVNRGINKNLQNAFDHTNADVVIAVAGDDISLPERVAISENLFNKFDVDIVNLSGYLIDASGKVIGEINNKQEVVDRDVARVLRTGHSPVNPVGHAIRSNVFYQFGPLPEDVPNEDDQINFRAICGKGIYCSSQKAYKYRVHDYSASAWLRASKSTIGFYKRYIKDLDVRQKHVNHWSSIISKLELPDQRAYQKLIQSRLNIYNSIRNADTYSGIQGVKAIAASYECLSLKESLFILLGSNGIKWYYGLKSKLKIHRF